MTDDRREEDAFFAGRAAALPAPPPPRRRESPLLARSPAIAVLALAISAWLLWDLAPEVAFFFSSRAPIDLGGPGAYRLEVARENRLAQVRGELVEGRLLPAEARARYAEAVAAMRARGAPLEDDFLVLRDGERPRKSWLPVAGSAILALLALVNLRALVKRLAA